MNFDILYKKYIFWGKNTLKMQGNHIVRIFLTFLPIFWSIYPKPGWGGYTLSFGKAVPVGGYILASKNQ